VSNSSTKVLTLVKAGVHGAVTLEDIELLTIQDGAVVDHDDLPTNQLSLYADFTCCFTRFEISWDGNTRSEGGAPYALAGNSGNYYFPFDYLRTTGDKRITVKCYNNNGDLLDDGTVTFKIIDLSPDSDPGDPWAGNTGKWIDINVNTEYVVNARHEAYFVMVGRMAVF
jgi:hypothetical protein